MPHLTIYRCNKCHAEQSASTDRLRLYAVGQDERLPVRAAFAWCENEKCLAAKEVLADLSELKQLLADLEKHGPALEDVEAARLLGEELAKFVARRKTLMRRMIDWLQLRKSPARCLHCGATDAAELPGTPAGPPREFPHPGCGGTFQFSRETPLSDAAIDLFSPEGESLQGAALLAAEKCLAYFRRATTDPASAPPWSDWWAENEKHASQGFSLVDYVRLKHRRLTGARQILQARGELPKNFVPPSADVTGSCEKCGDRVTRTGAQTVCPRCGS